MEKNQQHWFQEWFNDDYLAVYSHRNASEAEADIEALFSWLPLHSCRTALDLGCGAGRHATPLARRIPTVIGVDLSPALLREARLRAAPVSHFVRADFRHLPFPDSVFDLVGCFFTGFGYLDTDQDHLALLREWRRVLSSGGMLLLDYLSKEALISSLTGTTARSVNGIKISETRKIIDSGKRVEKLISMNLPDGGVRNYRESVRLYSREELTTLLIEAGYESLRFASDLAGSDSSRPNSEDSPRLVIAASARS